MEGPSYGHRDLLVLSCRGKYLFMEIFLSSYRTQPYDVLVGDHVFMCWCDHVIMLWCDHVVIWSCDHFVMWSCCDLIMCSCGCAGWWSCDHVLICCWVIMLSCDHDWCAGVWSCDHVVMWTCVHVDVLDGDHVIWSWDGVDVLDDVTMWRILPTECVELG